MVVVAMALLGASWTLTKKNLLVVFVRHWFFTTLRAFLAPIIFVRGVPMTLESVNRSMC